MDAFVSHDSGRTPTLDQPQLLSRHEDGAELAMALWRFGSPLLALSSAPYGGGWGERHWILAAQVVHGYHRTDPADHLAGLARDVGLDGPGIGMLTAVDVRHLGVDAADVPADRAHYFTFAVCLSKKSKIWLMISGWAHASTCLPPGTGSHVASTPFALA